MKIEPERPEHIGAIHALHAAAFPTDAEAKLVDALRADSDGAISLVCTDDVKVVGHVMLSMMSAPFRALALAPVTVEERHRRKGIAARLIKEGLARAKAGGWEAIFVLGEPDYYSRFGFSAKAAGGYTSRYAGPCLLLLDLTETGLAAKTGRVDHAPAFAALG